ncbi:MAG: hypothetical protein O2782_13910 [bacterium]|nr:hypothetical protein [bacterium]
MTIASRLAATVFCLALTNLAAAAADVPATLRHLHEGSLWGEITLESGRIRQIQVESLTDDRVAVREVVGALQVRAAEYPLSQIRSAREIGVHRIPQRTAPYRGRRSAKVALGLEVLVPGAGFFYAGDARQGYTMMGFAAVVAGTAIATGRDGAAGWLPLAAWIKVASLAQVRDQVGANNAASKDRASGMARLDGLRVPLLAVRF